MSITVNETYKNIMSKQFKLSRKDHWISGVCGGIAKYYNIDSLLVRIVFICASKILLPVYIIIMLFAPHE